MSWPPPSASFHVSLTKKSYLYWFFLNFSCCECFQIYNISLMSWHVTSAFCYFYFSLNKACVCLFFPVHMLRPLRFLKPFAVKFNFNARLFPCVSLRGLLMVLLCFIPCGGAKFCVSGQTPNHPLNTTRRDPLHIIRQVVAGFLGWLAGRAWECSKRLFYCWPFWPSQRQFWKSPNGRKGGRNCCGFVFIYGSSVRF